MGTATSEPLYCPKCNHLNEPEAERCVKCHAHLYVYCRDCGTKNQRRFKKCVECGVDLHREKRRRKLKNLYFESESQNIILVCVVILLALLAWAILRGHLFKRPLF